MPSGVRPEGETLGVRVERPIREGIIPREHVLDGTPICLSLEEQLEGLTTGEGAPDELSGQVTPWERRGCRCRRRRRRR